MGCSKCSFTGKLGRFVTDPVLPSDEGPTYWIEDDCPHCHGVDGAQPDWVTQINDAATQAEIDEAWRQHAEEET